MNLIPVESPISFGEIIPPSARVRVIGKTHPLAGGRVDRSLEVGLTIDEMLDDALEERPGMRGRADFVVHVNGDPIEERHWRRIRPKAGTVVTFVPRLQNSGVLRSVLSVVVALAAVALAGPLAGSLTIAGMALTPVTLSVATGLIGAGIMAAGPIARDALFGPKS